MPWSDSALKMIALITIRLKLLLRQKLGWISILVGVGLVLLALSIAQVSFINPQKIFWDFSLGVIFVLQVGLAVFLGSQLFHEERGRRTLHLILSAGVSRFQWLMGNVLGIGLGLFLMATLWFALTLGAATIIFDAEANPYTAIASQALLLQQFEVLIVLLFSILLSLILRQMLALSLASLLVILLHSMSSIQRVFADPQVGRFIDDNGASLVLWLARLLPPLEWLDIKLFVGYEVAMSLSFMGQMSLVAIVWIVLLSALNWLRFEKMDL